MRRRRARSEKNSAKKKQVKTRKDKGKQYMRGERREEMVKGGTLRWRENK